MDPNQQSPVAPVVIKPQDEAGQRTSQNNEATRKPLPLQHVTVESVEVPAPDGMMAMGDAADTLENVPEKNNSTSVDETVPLEIKQPAEPVNTTSQKTAGRVGESASMGARLLGYTSKRKATMVSAGVTAIVLLITGLSLWAQANMQSSTRSGMVNGVPVQDVDFDGEALESLPEGLLGEGQSLLVNGDIVANGGSLKVGTDAFISIIAPLGLTANQTLTLPSESGTLCLDTNNCNFATAGQLDVLEGQIAAPTAPDGTAIINGQTGVISLQGTPNQISVASGAGTLTLSLPQDIATGSSPTFSSLLLSGNITVGGVVTLPLDCSAHVNGGVLTTNPSGQIVCSDDDGTGGTIGGSGTPGTLALFTASSSLGDSLISQALGTVSLAGDFSVSGTANFGAAVAVAGDTTITGELNVSGASTLAGLSVTTLDASGNAVIDGTLTVAGTSSLDSVSASSLSLGTALTVANGGTGRTSFTSNGVLIGNGTGAIGITAAPTAGRVLVGNAGGVPTFVSMSGDVALSAAGVTTIQTNSVALGTDTSGNYVANISGGNGLAVSGSAGEGWTPTVSLGALTSNWSQTGAFDIILNNAASELSILESSGGTYFGTLDVGDLTVNQTYTLPDSSGTICLTSGNCAGIGGTGDILNNGQNGPITIGTNDNTSFSLETNNINRIELQADGDVAVATSALFVDATAHRIGLGTTSPNYKFEMNYNDSSSLGLTMALINTSTTGNSVAGLGMAVNNGGLQAVFASDGLGTMYGQTATILGTVTAHPLILQTSDTARLIVEADGDIDINSNTLFVDAFNQRVGIGTSTTTNKLTVNSLVTTAASSQVVIATGAATNVGLTLQGFGTSTTPNQTAQVFQLQDSRGMNRLTIDGSGNLLVHSSTGAGTDGSVAIGSDYSCGGLGANVQGACLTAAGGGQLILRGGPGGNNVFTIKQQGSNINATISTTIGLDVSSVNTSISGTNGVTVSASSGHVVLQGTGGNVGIGVNDPAKQFVVQGSAVIGNDASTGDDLTFNAGLYVRQSYAAANGSTEYVATGSVLDIDGANLSSSSIWSYGAYNVITFNSGQVANAVATQSSIYNLNTGSALGNAYASSVYIQNMPSATITNLYGYAVYDLVNQGTITNTYGLYVGDITSGTQTNQAYGLYVSDANARNYIAGRLGVGTATPGAALEVTGDIYLSKESARTIKVADSTTASTAGAQLNILGANGNSSHGGGILIQGGTGVGTSNVGGEVTIKGGDGSIGSLSRGGHLVLSGGAAPAGGGSVTISGGDALSSGAFISGGMVTINAGSNTNGAISSVHLQTGGGNTAIGGALASNILSVGALQYSTGTVGTGGVLSATITGSGTSWTSDMVGSRFSSLFFSGIITAVNSATSLTIDTPMTLPNGSPYAIHYIGLQVTSDGNIGIGDDSPASLLTVGTGDAFQVNRSGAIAAATGITMTGNFAQSGSGTFSTGTGAVSLNGPVTAASTLAVAGNAAIGGGLDSNSQLYVESTYSGVNGNQYGINSTLTVDTDGSTGDKIGINSIVEATSGGGSLSKVVAVNAEAAGTNVTDLIGLQASAMANQNIGSVTNVYGVKAVAGNDGLGVALSAYGLHVGVSYSGMGGQIISGYGVYIDEIEGQAASYGLYQADTDADNYFAGNLGVGTISPQAALHVNGTIRLEDFASCTALETDANGDLVCGSDDSGATAFVQGGNSFGATGVLGAADNFGLDILTNNTVRISISNDGNINFNSGQLYVEQATGNIGVGTTTNLGAKLTVNGTVGTVSEGDIFSQYDDDSDTWYPVFARYWDAHGTYTSGTYIFANGANGYVGIEKPGGGSAFKLEVKALDSYFHGRLTVNGHIISGNTSGVTTIAAGTAACTTPTVDLDGNDTAGTITITTGTGCAGTGVLGTVTFASTYGAAPRVVLSPDDANAAGLNYYTSNRGTTTFELSTNTVPTDATTYTYNYQVIQ